MIMARSSSFQPSASRTPSRTTTFPAMNRWASFSRPLRRTKGTPLLVQRRSSMYRHKQKNRPGTSTRLLAWSDGILNRFQLDSESVGHQLKPFPNEKCKPMRRFLVCLLLALYSSPVSTSLAQPSRRQHGSRDLAAVDNSRSLPRSTPERQGISSADILDFVDSTDQQIDTMNSFMLVRHGSVVAEGWWDPYDAATPHILYSLSKSFTSTAVGLAIGEGKMSLDDEVLKFFPNDAPAEPSPNLKAMRVRDLLRMATGNQTEAPILTQNVTWTKTFLTHPVPFKPGTHFLYNSPATYMLS